MADESDTIELITIGFNVTAFRGRVQALLNDYTSERGFRSGDFRDMVEKMVRDALRKVDLSGIVEQEIQRAMPGAVREVAETVARKAAKSAAEKVAARRMVEMFVGNSEGGGA